MGVPVGVAGRGEPVRGRSFDVARVRAEFPILAQEIRGRRLVYLDSAASTQKPRAVIDAVCTFYETENSNVHRGVHELSQRATKSFERARERIRAFLNAESTAEVIFTRGATDAINLVAWSYGRSQVDAGDEVLITTMEHHSNIVPWQMLCEEKGARLRVAPIDDSGALRMDELKKLINDRTKIVAFVHASNALGTLNPVAEIVEAAHRVGAAVVVDGAQAVGHLPVDVRALDVDFYALSGHKMFGPTGIGVLYGRRELLEAMPPYQGGGDMIKSVTFERTIYNDLPFKFEAGTPNIAGAIGLGAAVDYLVGLGLDRVSAYEQDLLEIGTDMLSAVPGLRLIGTAASKSSVLSFVLEGVHAHDVGTILDHEGVAIRTGHHCAQPVMDRFGVPATARASLSHYNTREDLEALVCGLEKVREVFS